MPTQVTVAGSPLVWTKLQPPVACKLVPRRSLVEVLCDGGARKLTVLPVLINELVTLPRQAVLVLDDYHLIDNHETEEGIAFLVEHLPSTLELVLATRSEPALPLARLRVRGHSVEIGSAGLRFSREEAGALLNDLHGLGLGQQEVSRLCERTEGWAAGSTLPR